MSPDERNHIQTWIERTGKRLQEIQESQESPSQKRMRASVDLCFLLGEIAATCFAEDTQAGVYRMIALYMNL